MVTGASRPRQVHALQEGAAEPLALLGLIRLVDFLSGSLQLGRKPCSIIVDSGTGVTATGEYTVAQYGHVVQDITKPIMSTSPHPKRKERVMM